LRDDVRDFAIGLLHSFRIWISDGFERLVNQNIRRKKSNHFMIGLGIYFAISEASRATDTVVFKDGNFDPFLIDAPTAWECEEIVRDYAEQVKVGSGRLEALGARFVAAIYGLHALEDAKSAHIAKRAHRSIETKVLLANEIIREYHKGDEKSGGRPDT
jgi:hypothetical protein